MRSTGRKNTTGPKTKINSIHNDWTNIKNKCRTTVGKDYTNNEPDSSFKRKLLKSEHSPIRLLEVDWSWLNIPSWVATHWSRHKFEKFITTSRTDRTGVNRDELPQNAPVRFDGFANAQHLIDAMRKRLCRQASTETRELAESLKEELAPEEPELSSVLVPNCVYRCGCPEFKQCGFWTQFLASAPTVNMTDIDARYDEYNRQFREKRCEK